MVYSSESKPAAAASSWLSKWWKKDSAPGPIKANLGEETAFYYDKDLKRWINKKVKNFRLIVTILLT
jgi:hypothetical protein